MTSPHKSKKSSLDALIGATLRSSVAGAEPSSQAWQRIESTVRRSTFKETDLGSSNKVEFGSPSRFQHGKPAHRPVV
jgi:hypothetical protein